jgi:hypothetical protein
MEYLSREALVRLFKSPAAKIHCTTLRCSSVFFMGSVCQRRWRSVGATSATGDSQSNG